MRIAVIGAGRIGGTIGDKWEAAGHDVAYGLRDASKKRGARSIEAALQGVDAVLLAIPGSAVKALAQEHGKDLDGKIVIDATNNFGGAAAHQWDVLAAAAPKAALYRVFNTYGFDVYAEPKIGGATPDMFFAGPEGASRGKVETLIKEVGLNPVWVGGADQADTVDGVLRLWFTLSRRLGRHIAFKLLTD